MTKSGPSDPAIYHQNTSESTRKTWEHHWNRLFFISENLICWESVILEFEILKVENEKSNWGICKYENWNFKKFRSGNLRIWQLELFNTQILKDLKIGNSKLWKVRKLCVYACLNLLFVIFEFSKFKQFKTLKVAKFEFWKCNIWKTRSHQR